MLYNPPETRAAAFLYSQLTTDMRSSQSGRRTIVPIPGNCSFHQTLLFLHFVSEQKSPRQSRLQTGACSCRHSASLQGRSWKRLRFSLMVFPPACVQWGWSSLTSSSFSLSAFVLLRDLSWKSQKKVSKMETAVTLHPFVCFMWS